MFTRAGRRLLIGLAISLVALIAAGVYYVYRAQQASIRQAAEAELEFVAQSKADQIARWRAERLGDAAVLGDCPFFAKEVARWLADPRPGYADAVVAHLSNILARYDYTDVVLTDLRGHVLLSASGDGGTLYTDALQALKTAVNERRPILTDLHATHKGAQTRLGAIAPILDETGAPRAAVVLWIEADDLLFPLVHMWPPYTQKTRVLLVRREGDHVLFLNSPEGEPDAGLTLRLPLSRSDATAVMAVSGQAGIVEGVDYRGAQVVAAILPIPDSPWFLVVEADRAWIYAEWQRYATLLLFLFAALLTAAGTGGAALWQGRTARYYRDRARVEMSLREIETRYRTTLLSIGDGVIVTDVEGRVETMNAVAERLTGWPASVAAGLPVQDVFVIVDEDTRQPVVNPAHCVLRDGAIVGLANHTLLIGRDGVERPISDSGAPVLDENGRVSGVVLVFRDQTEERAAQRALEESEARFRTLFEAGPLAIALHRLDGKLVQCNPKMVELLGFSQEELLEIDPTYPADREAGADLFQRLVAGTLDRYQREKRYVCRDGRILWAQLTAASILDAEGRPEHVAIVIEDISKRKQAEEALVGERMLLRTVIDNLPDAIYVKDAQGRKLLANPVALRNMGLANEAEALGKTDLEVYGAEDAEHFRQIDKFVLESGQATLNCEEILVRPDGEKLWLLTSKLPLRDSDGVITGLVGIGHDITARRQAEDALRESEATLRSAFEDARIGMALQDPGGRYLRVNDALCDILGFSREELLGMSYHEVTAPEYGDADRAIDEAMLSGAQDAHTGLEKEYVRKDGRRIWALVNGSMVRSAQDRAPAYCIVQVQDIDARKRAENALVESERELATLMANLPGMAYRCANNREWSMEFVSQGALELTGYRAEELVGEGAIPFHDITHPEDREAVHAAVKAAVAASRPFVIEYRIVDAEGAVKWVWERGQGVPNGNGLVRVLEGFITDITQRKQVEETLISERAELQAVYDYSPVMLSVMDSELRIVYANPAAARWANIPESELIGGDGCAAFGCIHALSDARGGGYGVGCEDCRLRHAALDTLETGQSHENIELHTTRAEGDQARRVSILASVASIGEIESRRLLLCMTDITDLAQAQEAVRQSELQYRHLANSGQALIWTSGPDKLCDYLNEPWLQFTGRTLEQELGLGWAEGVHPDDYECCVGTYVQAFERREPFSMSYRLRRHDGEYRWIQDDATPRYDPEGRLLGYIGHCLDITEQRQAQQALAESQARFYRLAEYAPDIIFRYRLLPERRLEYINAASEAITGYSAQECYADPMLMLNMAHPEDAHIMAEALASLRVPGEPLTMRWIGKDGESRWMETRMVGVYDEEGRLQAVEGITRDVTQRILGEQEQRRLEQRLQDSQKLEAVGRLAGGVAHDYNNMLQTILGYAELGIEDAPPESTLAEYLTEIREAARRSAALTRQLLAFARRQTVQPQELDLTDHATAVLKLVRRLIGANISVVLRPATDLGLVMMDPSQADQILINLVLNARDAIDEAGEIIIETRNVNVGPEYREQYPEAVLDEYVMMSVTDNGRGMDAETLSHLFEPFFTTKAVGEGTGLGLATVYGIVKQNQGFINVYSEPGMGSSFRIYLPRIRGGGRQTEQGTRRVALPHGSETVLLVEDDQALLRMGARFLEQLGYAVLAAPHPAEAERLCNEFPGEIHLLITDIVMPQTNGRVLAERLGRRRPGMRCLYMSGYYSDVVVQRNVLEGGEAFLHKPFAIETLAHKVRAVLES